MMTRSDLDHAIRQVYPHTAVIEEAGLALPELLKTVAAFLWTQQTPESEHTLLIRQALLNLQDRGVLVFED